jgi:hypothetical protein
MFRNQKGEVERIGFYEPYMSELIQRLQKGGTVAEMLLPKDEDITVSHGRKKRICCSRHKCRHSGCGHQAADEMEGDSGIRRKS